MDELLGSLVGFLLIIALIVVVVMYVIIPFLSFVGGVGAIYGGGIAIGNYAKSLRNNVKFS